MERCQTDHVSTIEVQQSEMTNDNEMTYILFTKITKMRNDVTKQKVIQVPKALTCILRYFVVYKRSRSYDLAGFKDMQIMRLNFNFFDLVRERLGV